MHTGLWSALESSVADLEIVLARADQGVAAMAILISIWFSTVRPALGLPLGLLCVGVFASATAAHALLVRGMFVTPLRYAMPVMEIALPGLALLVMTEVEGPGYALGSWVPPQLFCLFIAASILRLQPAVPLVMGVIAAAEFWLVYWFAIHDAVEGDGVLLHRVDVQLVRTGSLIITGAAGSMAVYGLKRIIGRANADLRAQELFGKYRLLREIASGGMGVVHEALYCPEGGFERKVAIKVIHPHLAADRGFVERFREEAEISARLAHPNLVSALDFGTVEHTYFFAMEFVDGPTLRDVLDRHRRSGQPLDAGLVALIGADVAEGLHFAHRIARDSDGKPLRVVHRDLSPANILIDRSGLVKILDFGVARALKDAKMVHTRNLVGKPSYLAPEQLEDHVVDERSDLWSLSVVLWELLCNTRLFRRREEAATMLAVINDDIPMPSSLRKDVAATWDAFFLRALNRDPEMRFQSALAVRDALRQIAEDHGNPDSTLLSQLAWTDEEDVELLDLDDDTGALIT
ncbi:MAG: serine/threonine protein kinase [Alphaproteobacteria bacterium]|nr:serine/threonine protein kinase [Alphaproteobacteria bacterium]